MVKRLVGYWEYFNALRNLDALAKTLKEGEREQLDEYLSKRSQFTIRTNLSEKYSKGQMTILADPPGADVEQRGLGWITALARIELGSMFAAYTKVPRPFEAVGPTLHDRKAYEYLLFDSIRSHYWALKNDPIAKHLPRSREFLPVLAYGRRMVMLRAMMQSLERMNSRQWTFAETRELGQWSDNLGEFRGMITAWLRNYLTEASVTRRTTTTIKGRTKCSDCLETLNGGDVTPAQRPTPTPKGQRAEGLVTKNGFRS